MLGLALRVYEHIALPLKMLDLRKLWSLKRLTSLVCSGAIVK